MSQTRVWSLEVTANEKRLSYECSLVGCATVGLKSIPDIGNQNIRKFVCYTVSLELLTTAENGSFHHTPPLPVLFDLVPEQITSQTSSTTQFV